MVKREWYESVQDTQHSRIDCVVVPQLLEGYYPPLYLKVNTLMKNLQKKSETVNIIQKKNVVRLEKSLKLIQMVFRFTDELQNHITMQETL